MKPACWPTWLDDVWAKSPDKGEGGEAETLAQHTWYVLSRLADFIRLRPDLPRRLGIPRLWHILYWSAFLHDFGKAASGFQAMLRGGDRWVHRHEVLSLAFLDWIASNFPPDEQDWLAAAIVSHHKDAGDIHCLYFPPDDPEDDQLIPVIAELDEEVIHGLWCWLAECSSAWIDDLGLRDLGVEDIGIVPEAEATDGVQNAGAARINDWLKTYRRFVRRLERRGDRLQIIGTLALRGHMINADHSASAHAGQIPTVRIDAETVLTSCGLASDDLFAHQRDAMNTAGSALLVAPTGSGKTEAALLWATGQAIEGRGMPRLFYTLPYQASMNAMKFRLDTTFGEKNVGLQHGRGLLALYRILIEREYDPKDAARQARWLRNLAQLNYPPVRVFSPYQILKGMYRLKGYEARLTDYHNAAFIFDEIHAYEVRRLAMILETMRYLAEHYDARFFVMSATFPSLIMQWLGNALNNPPVIYATPTLFEQFVRHRVHLLDGEVLDDPNLQKVEQDALAGKSVLVVCNLVDRAQQVFEKLAHSLGKYGIEVELLHGRFNMRDRSAKEALIRDATGSTSKKRRAIVLVATQAVEVSLDIDLDTIYSEPAPLEALVQRFGRINRRRKQTDLAPVYVFRQPDDGQVIYDVGLLTRTMTILERENGRPIDESKIGTWLDEIYAGEIAERWRREYQHAAMEFRDTCIASLRAFQSDDTLEELFYQAFDGTEVLPMSLWDDFMTLREEDPIRAGELLVPISWRRWHALANQGRVLPREKRQPYVVKANYSSRLGLTFDEGSALEDF
ncbi:MAG: CRISPR-associated helicase Cas3' [Nitrospirae bacterium]|nr:MAG: CRISPR-associated helicase Cas3' [Nitrospirota bacterium]